METEILRGAKVRITTESARVGNTVTPIADMQAVVLVEADHSIKLVPKVLLIAGPVAGVAIDLLFNALAPAILVCLIIMGFGAALLRGSWLHQVRARLPSGRSIALYRTPRISDARLFHAALQKALELRASTSA